MKSILISALAALIVAMSAQSAHAIIMEIHNHKIPEQGRTIKYEFFNESIHYVYFATCTVFPGHGVILIDVPDDKFQPGDIVKGCAVGLGYNPFSICANTIAMPAQGLEYDFDVY